MKVEMQKKLCKSKVYGLFHYLKMAMRMGLAAIRRAMDEALLQVCAARAAVSGFRIFLWLYRVQFFPCHYFWSKIMKCKSKKTFLFQRVT